MALTCTIYAGITAVESGALDLGTPTFELRQADKTVDLASGTGSGQASKIWSDERTLAASATEDLDLAGVLVDALGPTLTFATVKAIYVEADAANTNNVVIGNGTAPAIGGPLGAAGANTISIGPGGRFLWVNPGTGLTVTATTADILKVANSSSGTGVTYKIVVVGT